MGKRLFGRTRTAARAALLALGLAGAAAGAAPATPPPSGAAPAPRLVRVGLYQNSPKVFTDDAGRPAGIFVELLAEIARQENWRLEYLPGTWSECLRALEENRLDLLPDVAYSRERDARYDFHQFPVVDSWSQLYARPAARVSELADLQGRRIAVLREGIQQEVFQRLLAGFGFKATIVTCESWAEAFQLAATGGADAAIANNFFGEFSFQKYGLVKTPIIFNPVSLYYATGAGRNPELLRAVDRHLDRWRREPYSPYYLILGRWLARPPATRVPRQLVWALALISGGLVFAAGIILLLRAQVRARTRRLAASNSSLAAAQGRSENLARFPAENPNPVLRYSRQNELLYANPAGQALLQDWGPAAEGLLTGELAAAAAAGQPRESEVAAGSRRFQLLLVPVAGQEYTNIYGREITAQRQAEERLRQAQKLEALGRLAGGVAHDFNNLLSVILGYGEFIRARLPRDSPLRGEVEALRATGERATRLTRQLLAFSRKQVLQPRVLDLNAAVREQVKLLQRLIGEDIALDLRLGEGLSPVLADPGQLDQILLNLALNARDAMPAGGTLTFATAETAAQEAEAAQWPDLRPGRYLRLAVGDTGCGMDEKTMARAGEPFFTTKGPGRGTGLGLATVFGIVRQSGGAARLESAPGRGTRVEILLPRAEAPAAAAPAPAPVPEDAGLARGETVLVAEDDPPLRELVARALREQGYAVLAAGRGEEALRLAEERRGPIHLLFADVVLPGLSSRALAEKLRAGHPEMKVLFTSGYTDDLLGQRGALEPGLPFLEKPFSLAALLRQVREALDRR